MGNWQTRGRIYVLSNSGRIYTAIVDEIKETTEGGKTAKKREVNGRIVYYELLPKNISEEHIERSGRSLDELWTRCYSPRKVKSYSLPFQKGIFP